MSAVNLDEQAFQELVIAGKRPALVDFWAPWCGHCRRIAPAYDRLAGNHPELLVAKVNIDEAPGLAACYGIEMIPTIVAFRNGETAGAVTAPESAGKLEAFLAQHLG